MAISRYDMDLKVEPEVVAAIVAVLAEILEEETPKKVRPYVLRKNRGWKGLTLQEGALTVHLLGR